MDHSHPLAKTLDAAEAGDTGGLSTGEALMAALALNRADWLAKMGYSMAEAFDRIGPEWRRMLPAVARDASQAMSDRARQRIEAAQSQALDSLQMGGRDRKAEVGMADAEPIEAEARLVTTGNAPGYRDATLVFDLAVHGQSAPAPLRVALRLRPEDGAVVASHIREVHALAWSSDRGPLDARPGETRPRWIGD